MVNKRKKIVILSVMVALLVVTGFLNITLNDTSSVQTSATTYANFFETYRADRNSTRSQEVTYYDAIIASTTSTADAKTLAETKKQELVATMEQELVLEGLIKAKGFEDAIVTMSTSNVNVVVKDASLQANEVAQIVQVVQEATGKDIDNIKIIPVE